jgi:flagellar assembly factor FliW
MTVLETDMLYKTHYFGPLEYEEESVLEFPDGIPAFEQEKRFLALRQPINHPLVFLQSLSNPNLCFVTLPVQAAYPRYRLRIAPEDLTALGLAPNRQPAIGRDVLCLTIVSVEENAAPTANLLAPIIVNLKTQCARQVIQSESNYSYRQPLPVPEDACS